MYEEMIQCHVIMNRKERGIDLAQERIAIEPTPSLYCALGELTNDTEHYLTAWELSGRRYARAKRMLARTLLRQGKVCVFLRLLGEQVLIAVVPWQVRGEHTAL